MFKKIMLVLSVLSLIGCSKVNKSDISNELIKKVNRSESYYLKGNLILYNDLDNYEYDIDVTYLKDNNYIVNMINTNNNRKQIILKNEDGLYVITPSLNKSFKFDSKWPDNSSQIYILSSVIKDIKNDENKSIDLKNKIITTKVNYINNSEINSQKIYLNKNNEIEKIEVYDKTNNLKMMLKLSKFDLSYNAKNNDFNLNNFIDNNESNITNEQNVLSSIEEAIYPLYIPSNTFLNSSETISNEEENRIILTFSGEKNFTIVEEGLKLNEEMEIIPVYGNPEIINNSIAAISENSIYWECNDINYYITSNDLSTEQMMVIASSIGSTTSVISQK